VSGVKKVCAIVVAGGIGKRMNSVLPKQFLRLNNKPIIVHCLEKFEVCPFIHEIVLVGPSEHISRMEQVVKKAGFHKIAAIVGGGPRRQDSVKNGLDVVSEEADIILIHDGVRPFVTTEQIECVVDMTMQKRAALLAVPVTNTIKKASRGIVTETLDRRGLWQAQTPQGFEKSLIRQAFEMAALQKIVATDDASLVEQTGQAVHIVEGSRDNIKITTAKDLAVAERILERQ
jgi:2-C-methyl-D-erythritol 4-phosphate cytidylyltransferase